MSGLVRGRPREIQSLADLKTRCTVVGECWIYQVAAQRGRAMIYINGKGHSAGAAVVMLTGDNKVIPKRFASCGNKWCVCPAHRLASSADAGRVGVLGAIEASGEMGIDRAGLLTALKRKCLGNLKGVLARLRAEGVIAWSTTDLVWRAGEYAPSIDDPIVREIRQMTIPAAEAPRYRMGGIPSIFEMGRRYA